MSIYGKEIDMKISKAAKLVNAGKYEEFEKIDFDSSNAKSADIKSKVVDSVLTLEGVQYLEKKGFIPEGYFTKDCAIFEASPAQVDFYIQHGARVNDVKIYENYEGDTEQYSFLRHIAGDSRYSAENVKSVINAGGKFVYGDEPLFRSRADRPITSKGRAEMMAKMLTLNKAGLLDEDDKRFLMKVLPVDAIAKLADDTTLTKDGDKSVRYRQYNVREPEFGSSTEFCVKYVNGIAEELIDRSTHETNWKWDRFIDEEKFLGKGIRSIEDKLKHDFDNFEDEFRTPYWVMQDISKDDWKMYKKEKDRDDRIRAAVEAGVKKANKRAAAKRQNPDRLAEKAEALGRATRSVKMAGGLSPEEEAQARIAAYKEFHREK